ncbi:MAG: EAL domain-containing protein [Chloroflexota bacterium]
MKVRLRLSGLPDTVSGRIAAVLGLLLTILIAIVLVAGWQSRQQVKNVDESANSSDVVTNVQQGALAWLFADTLAGRYIVSPSPELEATIHGTEQGMFSSIAIARRLEVADAQVDDVADLDAVRAQAERSIVTRQQVLDAANAGNQTVAAQLLLQGVADSQSVTDAFTRVTTGATADVQASRRDSQNSAVTLTWILIIGALTAAILGLMAAVAISRSVVRPLSHLRATAKSVGEGNLAARAEIKGPREIRELAAILNSTASSMAQRDSALKTSHELLNASLARWRTLVENSHDLVLVVAPDMKVAFVNSAVESILGYPPGEFVGSDALAIVHPADVESSGDMFAKVASGQHDTGIVEARVRRADGSYAFMEGIPSRIQWGDEYAILLNARDVSEQKRANETIAHMAYHDSLTGLPNRLLLQDRLDIAIAQAKRSATGVCVMSVDVDRFKNVNDLLGHAAGDELLKQVADRLAMLVREGDTVARLGGDEFVLVFPHCEAEHYVEETAQRIIEGFRRPFRISDREIYISVSAGYAHGDNAVTLLRNADVAMYAAKEGGRNAIRRFSEGMNKRTSEWFVLEAELRRAIDNGEFVVYYQPQVRVDSGEVTGAEALVRWNHPERGMIPPSDFIPLAEETGLINQLGELVLREACREAVTWRYPLRISVNVSLRQFERPDFFDRVVAVVRETGIAPERLELEITETTALRDIDKTREVAIHLTDAGMRLSIDDFGAGSTSLRYLIDVPLHTVKIDQAFILKLKDNPANAAIASTIISLGHKLNLNVIAEGVETQEQLDFLRGHYCDEFQGFLMSRPVPAEQFRAIANVDRPVVSDAAQAVTILP